MKTKIRYIAPVLALAAIGGAISLAPVALAAPGAAATAQLVQPAAAAAAPSPSPSPAPTQPTSGDPAVPFGTYIGGFDNSFDGNQLAS
ncbi:hypothetical protein [Mycobacterium sp.]|uniref:hypothetical protein n=1 Tax=Mycobacterium sp. TaxID=1785 RepID=UPI002D7A1E41|nr:hypothetical protein [Mycobacterium sp.]